MAVLILRTHPLIPQSRPVRARIHYKQIEAQSHYYNVACWSELRFCKVTFFLLISLRLFRFLFNRNSEEYRRYRQAVEDLRKCHQQQLRTTQYPSHDDNKYDPIKTFEDEIAASQTVITTPDVVTTTPAIPEKMVYASIDKSDSSDSDTEYHREAKKRNLKNLRHKARYPDSVTQVRKRNADSTDSEDDTDHSHSHHCDIVEAHIASSLQSAASNDATASNTVALMTQEQHLQLQQQHEELKAQVKQLEQEQRGIKRELEQSESSSSAANKQQRSRKSRWGEKVVTVATAPIVAATIPPVAQQVLPNTGQAVTLTAVRRSDPALLKYAIENYGSVNLSEEDWKKAEEHYKINLLYQDMVKKRQEIDRLAQAGKFKYEYDSDEDVTGGTWEHKLRVQEMEATQLWADALTKQAEGKHHIGKYIALLLNCNNSLTRSLQYDLHAVNF